MTKKKIGILNFQYSTHNYGAVLQAAALEYILKSEGHDVEHINYIPSSKKNTFKGMAKKVLTSLGVIRAKQKIVFRNSEAFERFREKFLRRTPKITTPKQFYHLARRYDAVVVGSDQVWRPKMVADSAAFFLAYLPDNIDRVSYAASFGSADWEEMPNAEITKLAERELAKFKAISCRETSGINICKSNFRVEAVHVLDPLLQVSDAFIGELIDTGVHSTHKLVYYKLGYDERFLSELRELEEDIGKKAYNIYRKNGVLDEYEEVTDWIRSIHDAELVVSDSFHCICLAIRFGKKVLYYPNPAKGQARLDDLFDYLEIEVKSYGYGNRMKELRVSSYTRERILNLKRNSIDYIRRAFS